MIFIASDHAGYTLKSTIISFLRARALAYKDLGTVNQDRVDYTDYAQKLCEEVLKSKLNKGILICGTGIGMSIMANRIRGIRAALCTNVYMARMCVMHNNANVLCLGSRVIGDELATNIVSSFLKSSFEGGRHEKRVKQYDTYE